MKLEYQVEWKRVDRRPKSKVFKTRAGYARFLLLLGPEPWKYFRKDPNARVCCSGWECNCMGVTVAEECEHKREGMPPIEWVRIKQRRVSNWKQTYEKLHDTTESAPAWRKAEEEKIDRWVKETLAP
jgi:hypothetical protein